MKIYLVGGAVRDKLLGKEPHDKDYVVVGSTIDEMLSLGYKQVGKEFPVFLHPETGDEYALARTERKTGYRHTDFSFDFNSDVTLEDDLARRDVTINAIAYNVVNEECWSCCLNDPFGGVRDLENKILRAVRPETFVEDPLRLVRVCRFSAQLDFEIAPETMELMKKMVNDGMMEHLTAERVWKETEKALNTNHFDKFILSMKECGALKVLMPEIDNLFDIPEKIEYHPLGNTGLHVIECLKYANKENPLVIFTTLIHDIGKQLTPKEILPAHHDHEHRGLDLINQFCDRLKIPNDYRNFALLVCRYHMRFIKMNDMAVKKQYDFVKELSDNFRNKVQLQNFLKVCEADYFGETPYRTDSNEFYNALNEIMKVYDIMTNKTLKDLPIDVQENLFRHTGVKFGGLYREAMISYLKHKLWELKNED